MNFFDFATLARKKGNGILDNSTALQEIQLNKFEHSQTVQNKCPNSNKNDQKAFELISSMNEELDHMLEETKTNANEITLIIDEFSHLNNSMEILFGEVVSDLKTQIK